MKKLVILVVALIMIAPFVSAQDAKQAEREATYYRYSEFPSCVKGGSITPHWMANGSSSASIWERGTQSETPSVLGNGQGLTEVIVLVRDLALASDLYRDRLGFTLAPLVDTLPSGLKLIGAKFERNNYLELRSIADREKATRLRPRIVQFLEKNEGGFLIVLQVSSAKSTAVYLRTRGFKVNEESYPEFSVVSFEGTYELPTEALPPGTTEPIWTGGPGSFCTSVVSARLI